MGPHMKCRFLWVVLVVCSACSVNQDLPPTDEVAEEEMVDRDNAEPNGLPANNPRDKNIQELNADQRSHRDDQIARMLERYNRWEKEEREREESRAQLISEFYSRPPIYPISEFLASCDRHTALELVTEYRQGRQDSKLERLGKALVSTPRCIWGATPEAIAWPADELIATAACLLVSEIADELSLEDVSDDSLFHEVAVALQAGIRAGASKVSLHDLATDFLIACPSSAALVWLESWCARESILGLHSVESALFSSLGRWPFADVQDLVESAFETGRGGILKGLADAWFYANSRIGTRFETWSKEEIHSSFRDMLVEHLHLCRHSSALAYIRALQLDSLLGDDATKVAKAVMENAEDGWHLAEGLLLMRSEAPEEFERTCLDWLHSSKEIEIVAGCIASSHLVESGSPEAGGIADRLLDIALGDNSEAIKFAAFQALPSADDDRYSRTLKVTSSWLAGSRCSSHLLKILGWNVNVMGQEVASDTVSKFAKDMSCTNLSTALFLYATLAPYECYSFVIQELEDLVRSAGIEAVAVALGSVGWLVPSKVDDCADAMDRLGVPDGSWTRSLLTRTARPGRHAEISVLEFATARRGQHQR